MKRVIPLSIRQRITLWYGAAFLGMTGIIASLFIAAAVHIFKEQSEDNTARIALLLANNADLEQGRIVLNLTNKERKKFIGGLRFALYAPDGQTLDGNQEQWMNDYAEKPDKIRRVRRGGNVWFIYDKPVYHNGVKAGWVRAALSGEEYIEDLGENAIAWIGAFAFSLGLAALGGILIAGKALKPIQTIAAGAREIGGGDLSRRLPFSETKDEIGGLAAAFNEMAGNLEEAFAREKQFASDVSHELRTPLAVITAHAENAEQVNDLETFKQANAAILHKSRHLQRMIGQILTFAREREQADSMRFEDVDLTVMLAGIAEEAAEWAAEKNIAVETNLPEGLRLKADMLLLTRLFLNLLDNAVKYGRLGGWVKVAAEKDGAESIAVVTISDNGEGIPEADLPHIFKRFYRADKARSGEGAGLGLSFAEMIVRLHRGSITAQSVPDVETRFTVKLPLRIAVLENLFYKT